MKAYSNLMKHLKSKDPEEPIDEDVLKRKEDRFQELSPEVKPIIEMAEENVRKKLVFTNKGKKAAKSKEGNNHGV